MRLFAAILVPLLMTTPAHADPARDAMAEVARCADIADSTERLKCFDKAAVLAKSALASSPQPQQTAEKRSFLDWFGFPKPATPPRTPEEYGKPAPAPDAEGITSVSSNVLEFARTSRGQSVFILENGQIWRQSEGDTSVVRDPPAGQPMKVTIENGFLGSYNLSIEGRNGLIKVTRIK
jgi:hypothetical protein